MTSFGWKFNKALLNKKIKSDTSKSPQTSYKIVGEFKIWKEDEIHNWEKSSGTLSIKALALPPNAHREWIKEGKKWAREPKWNAI